MFLFQTSLSFEDFSHSNSSTSDLDPFSDISSDDTPDVSDITTLPDILSVPFKFMSHLGIVAIQDEFFADKALSLRDKLATGKIYEHPGPYLKQSNDAFGRPVDTTFLNNITALGFIAYSNMDDTELDVLGESTSGSFRLFAPLLFTLIPANLKTDENSPTDHQRTWNFACPTSIPSHILEQPRCRLSIRLYSCYTYIRFEPSSPVVHDI